MTPKAQTPKENVDELDFIKIKKTYSKDTSKKVKRHPTEWENIPANYISDKGFVSRVYKELLQLNK